MCIRDSFNSRRVPFNEAQALIKKILPDAGFTSAYETISKWPGYQPTSLINLDNVADALGVKSVFYKNEAERFGLKSFKALGGAYAVHKCLEMLIGKNHVSDHKSPKIKKMIAGITVTSATDGNHGKSVAWGAKMFGCKCVIFIHEKVSKNRENALKKYGAQVVRAGKNYDESVKIAQEKAKENDWHVISDTSYAGYSTIPKHVMNGYEVMIYEAVIKQSVRPVS